jgi:hypothetical protein
MRTEWKSEHGVDRLLSRVLRDDLPAEAEFRMKRRLSAFRRSLQASADPRAEKSGAWWYGPGFQRWSALHPLFRKEVLACASAIMLAAGTVMHLGGYGSVLADSISLLKISLSVAEQVRLASSMDCTIRMSGEGALAPAWKVRWVRGAGTRVDVDGPGGTHQTFWVVQGRVTAPGEAAQSPNLTEPVAALLVPADLASRLDGGWQLRREAVQSEADRLVFAERRARAVIEVRFDTKTFLPVHLRRIPSEADRTGGGNASMSADFVWNKPVARELMGPGLGPGK